MERRRSPESGQSAGGFQHETQIIRPPEQPSLLDGGRSASDSRANFRALVQQRLLDGALTEGQRDSLGSLLGKVSEFRSENDLSASYKAWWRQLEGLVREVQSTLRRSLSDAEWDALTSKVFIAWEQTGILEGQLRAQTVRDTIDQLRAQTVRDTIGQRSVRAATLAALHEQPRSSPRRVEQPERPF
jgi:hypothetical protein